MNAPTSYPLRTLNLFYKLVDEIGVDEVLRLLEEIEEKIEGIPKRKLNRVVSRLCVVDESEIDGG